MWSGVCLQFYILRVILAKIIQTYCVTVTFIIVPVSSELFIHVQPLLHVSHNSDREILFRVLIPTCQLTIGEWLGGVSLAPQPHTTTGVVLYPVMYCSCSTAAPPVVKVDPATSLK